MSCSEEVQVVPFAILMYQKKMADLKEKLVCIKFCFKLEKSAIEIFNT